MNMTLKSYQAFADYEDKMNQQYKRLQGQIEENDRSIEAVKREYASLYVEGSDTSKVGAKLTALKSLGETLKGEVEIIDASDFREKQMAREVYDQFLELEKEWSAETERLWQKSEKAKDDCEATIVQINKDLEELSLRLSAAAKDQLSPVVEHLDFSESLKDNIKMRLNSGLIGGYTSVRNITR